MGYQLYRVKKVDDTYRIIESYTSPEALQTHRDNPATKEESMAIRPYFAAPPVIEFLEKAATE